jgi:translation initiation factor IF-1
VTSSGTFTTSDPDALVLSLSKDETLSEVEGIVTEQLPSALYRVRLDAGSVVTAHVADRIERNFIRVLIGDRVRIELSPVDLKRGRIIGKVE